MSQLPFRKLQIWQKGFLLTRSIYTLTARFPENERYGLTSQMRRASVSIPSNIAEGSQRGTDKDFAHFILTAKGSLAELETQLLLAQALGYVDELQATDILNGVEELSKMLRAFHTKLTANR